MLKINLRKGLVAGILFLISSISVFGQSSIGSPYSSFGLGNLTDDNNDRNRAMGKLGVGMRDYFTINFKNPASYTVFDSTSFLFEGGFKGNYSVLQTADLNEEYFNITLSHILFGFPVTKWWKTSFGLVPYSMVGYQVIDSDVKEDIGRVRYSFEGSGGTSEFYWGNAVQFTDFLSVGFNASYMFGTIEQIQRISFPDSAYIQSSRTNNSFTLNDVKFEFGAQYFTKINNNLDLVLGATYRPKQDLKAKRSSLVNSYLGGSSGIDFDTDTISYIEDEPGIIVFPGGFGVGFSIAHGFSWLFGADYVYDQWEDYRNFNVSDSLVNSHTFKAGGHYIPNSNSFSYFQRVDYRVGFNYSLSNLQLRGEQLNGFGITFGVGLPIRSVMIRGSRSMVNLGFEYGRRGTLVNGLIKEKYYLFNVGITIYERWFIKRRYD